jgi:hypothetical protein
MHKLTILKKDELTSKINEERRHEWDRFAGTWAKRGFPLPDGSLISGIIDIGFRSVERLIDELLETEETILSKQGMVADEYFGGLIGELRKVAKQEIDIIRSEALGPFGMSANIRNNTIATVEQKEAKLRDSINRRVQILKEQVELGIFKSLPGSEQQPKDIMKEFKNAVIPRRTEIDPWRVICSCLFELSSSDIPDIIDRAGLRVDWSLTEKQDYSHSYRKAAYRPRINSAYEALSQEDQLRVVYVVASELAKRGFEDKLNSGLEQIGWRIESGRLIPGSEDVRELFFPKASQHDAYVEMRRLLQKAHKSITIVDPYFDSSVFIMLGTLSSFALSVRLLTYQIPSDFTHEGKKFLSQHGGFNLEIRRSPEFHDRFIILDDAECWHVGCSIKDAGTKAFMLSQVEDKRNRDALIKQLNDSWVTATAVTL